MIGLALVAEPPLPTAPNQLLILRLLVVCEWLMLCASEGLR